MDDETRAPVPPGVSRKTLLRAAAVALPAPLLLGAAAPVLARNRAGAAKPLSTTPQCTDGDPETPPQIEGPYFKPGSPLRSDLVDANTPGTPLVISGYVFGVHCQPLSACLLDFWQADDDGNYDNEGYTLRGHQFSTGQGGYQLSTIVPGLYPGRTRHVHVKVQAPDQPILTTQLYFPNEPRNNTDELFDPRLLMTVRSDGMQGTFDFVLDVPAQPA